MVKTIKLIKFGYDVTVRASERPSVRTDSGLGGGESQGNPNGGAQECHLFLAGFKKRKLISIVMSTNDSRVDITFSRQGLIEAERERELQRARINRQRRSQEDRERERARAREVRERRRNSTEQCREVERGKGDEIIPNSAVKQSE